MCKRSRVWYPHGPLHIYSYIYDQNYTGFHKAHAMVWWYTYDHVGSVCTHCLGFIMMYKRRHNSVMWYHSLMLIARAYQEKAPMQCITNYDDTTGKIRCLENHNFKHSILSYLYRIRHYYFLSGNGEVYNMLWTNWGNIAKIIPWYANYDNLHNFGH